MEYIFNAQNIINLWHFFSHNTKYIQDRVFTKTKLERVQVEDDVIYKLRTKLHVSLSSKSRMMEYKLCEEYRRAIAVRRMQCIFDAQNRTHIEHFNKTNAVYFQRTKCN